MNCDRCGVECLEEGSKYICPNHGIIEDIEDFGEDKDRIYIG